MTSAAKISPIGKNPIVESTNFPCRLPLVKGLPSTKSPSKNWKEKCPCIPNSVLQAVHEGMKKVLPIKRLLRPPPLTCCNEQICRIRGNVNHISTLDAYAL